MKKFILIYLCVLSFVTPSCQDKDFDKIINANQGINTTFVKFPDNSIQTTGKPQMIYPPAGIPLSTGSGWSTTSIINNSTNWDMAFSWGNHVGLYRSITWVPTWDEIPGKPPEQSLIDGLGSLPYLRIPRHTTIYINSIIMPPDESGIVFDITVGEYKVWKPNQNIWSIIPTNN